MKHASGGTVIQQTMLDFRGGQFEIVIMKGRLYVHKDGETVLRAYTTQEIKILTEECPARVTTEIKI